MARKRRSVIDWSDVEEKYINSDKDLYEFSAEATGNELDPAWVTLKTRSAKDNWRQKRLDHNVDTLIESESKGAAIQDQAHVSMVAERDKLLSADLVIRRHIQIAESFQSLYLDVLPAIKRATRLIDWDAIAENDPRSLILMWKDLNSVTSASIEIERKSMSLADAKIELFTTSKSSLDITTRDLKSMSEKELTEAYLTSCRQVE